MTNNLNSTTAIPEQHAQSAGIRFVHSTEIYPELGAPGASGLPLLLVENPLGRAVIALQGAHLMAFKPKGQREIMWLSPKCTLNAGTPIRGGIPLCLPWFGPGPDGKSAHGFARTANWSLAFAEKNAAGATRLTLELVGDASTSALWPHGFVFRLEFVVGTTLEMRLSVENRSETTAPLAFAFHTYFAVPDVGTAHVTGLQGSTCIDKLAQASRSTQQGPVTISAATDRIYLNVPARQTIENSAGPIVIESDAACAVVWNAWDNDKNIADMGEGNHIGYLCVERGEIADRTLTLQPGETYRTWMTVSF